MDENVQTRSKKTEVVAASPDRQPHQTARTSTSRTTDTPRVTTPPASDAASNPPYEPQWSCRTNTSLVDSFAAFTSPHPISMPV